MVLGIKSKNKKGVFYKLDYLVHVQEIRPWPPSETLKHVQTVLLQWENSEKSSGSFLSVAGESNIAFNESFVLSPTLYQKSPEKFKKNFLEFILSEPRKDKASKGHILGTASLNLAEYGLIEDIISVSAPLSFKKNGPNNNINSIEPALFISIEPIERDNSPSSSPRSKAASFYDNDSEFASLTDDDASSHSSRTASSSSSMAITTASPSRNEVGLMNLRSASTRAPSDSWSKVNKYVSSFKFAERSMSFVRKNSTSPLVISSPISVSSTIEGIVLNSSVANAKSSPYEETAATKSPSDVHFSRKESISSHSLSSVMRSTTTDDALNDDMAQSSSDDVIKSQVVVPKLSIPQPPNSSKARLKHAKSVSIRGYQSDGNNNRIKPVDIDSIPMKGVVPQKKGKPISEIEGKEQKKAVEVSEDVKQWKRRAELLEEELKETAVIEVALYATLPEHSSSREKVHSPARRLSRFYTNACREGSQARRASAARAIVSGLILVSRACGNDVSRLTFWLSNSIMLRSAVSETASSQLSAESKEGSDDDWEDVLTFIIALEKVESWLFSRIVESVWWQSFMPHMQPPPTTAAKRSRRISAKKRNLISARKSNLGCHEHSNTSIELWKKAFRDACERLCPVLAGGHECGCLNFIVRLVMEQLVNRLDVAMFNAILRGEETPIISDPLNDPISSKAALPVPAGKSSFGAGAQLKNAIGNWSRLLTDVIGLEDECNEDGRRRDDHHHHQPFKAFRLVHALSDLMMLPFGMLADPSTRKEVCPTLGPAIVKRVLKNFVPDDFCPGPVPTWIIDVLSSEEITEDTSADTTAMVTSFPFSSSKSSAKYSPPSEAAAEIGQVRKSYYNSDDDEMDEVESPLTSIVPDSYNSLSALAKLSAMPKDDKDGGRRSVVVRYKLLREMDR